MNDTDLSDLNIQGHAINTPNRPQWSGGPRGTIISVLERANVYDHTMNDETSDISLKALANRVNSNRKNETYIISTPKSIIEKPVVNDLVVEDLNQTLTSQNTIIPDKDELVECLTTGHFDAKNKLVRRRLVDRIQSDLLLVVLASSNCYKSRIT